MPYASFIIPVRNVEDYLGATLASLQAQTDGDFEVIVVDDGSTDATAAIAAAIAAVDRRFRILAGRAAGPGVARNLAIDAAAGQLLVFVDGDDLVHPRYLELIRTARSGLGAADVLVVSYVSGTEIVWSHAPTGRLRRVNAAELAVRGKAIWRMVVTREFFAACGARFLPGMNYEDTVPALQLILAGERFVEMTEPLYFYRKRPNSLIRRPGTERIEDMVKALAAMAEAGRRAPSTRRRGLVQLAQIRLLTSLYRLLPPVQRQAYLTRALDAAELDAGTAIRRAVEAVVRARGVWLRPTLSLIADLVRASNDRRRAA
ncbi:MAG: glycosyltransferase family 2 protein [Pseudomonadota bacterium]